MKTTQQDQPTPILEAVLREVGESVLALEQAIARTEQALAVITDQHGSQNERVALQRALTDLQRVRQRLVHDGYHAGRQQRLM